MIVRIRQAEQINDRFARFKGTVDDEVIEIYWPNRAILDMSSDEARYFIATQMASFKTPEQPILSEILGEVVI